MATRPSSGMAGKGSARKKGKEPVVDPSQKKILQYFKPRNESSSQISHISSDSEGSQRSSSVSCSPQPSQKKRKQKQRKLSPSSSVLANDTEEFNNRVTTFSQLSEEIVQVIFCQLPLEDLKSCALVCRQWKNIISRDTFIPWKKKYFCLKNRDANAEDSMAKLIAQKGISKSNFSGFDLISLLNDFAWERQEGREEDLFKNLKKHCKFPHIETFLHSHETMALGNLSPYSFIGLLTWFCQTPDEVQAIVSSMAASASCMVLDIVECFYCLAAVFYYLESQNILGSEYHNRVYHTLYLYETTNTTASTGKTTTLVEYTKRRPEVKFLNVAYNKAIQDHARKTFPSNVESRTIHSLAHKNVGFKYKHKLAKYGLRINAIMKALPPQCGFLHARRVEETLNNFIASADPVLESKHVPLYKNPANDESQSSSQEESELYGKYGKDLTFLNSSKYKQEVAKHAEELWERMRNLEDWNFQISHDGYLKVYQLSKPTLSGFDCLLIDEAQDCTPDILLRQNGAKILVGDPHQQIYAFRGARNALQEVESTHTFHLTQSFRFGPEVAHLLSSILSKLKNVQDKTLVGTVKKDSALDESGQLCVITRTNYTLFDEVANVCCARDDVKVGFVGGLRSLSLERVKEVNSLRKAGNNEGNRLGILDPLIKKFKSFATLKKYARLARDLELLAKIKIAETDEGNLEHKIERIESNVVRKYQEADFVFSTAHKAKGLQFDTVRVTDDFFPGVELKGSVDGYEEDEKNLVYVAASRAKKCLHLREKILWLIGFKGSACEVCRLPFKKDLVVLGETKNHKGGILCLHCGSKEATHLQTPGLSCSNTPIKLIQG